MLLIRKDLLVESVTYGVEEAEVLKISLRQNIGRYHNVVVTCVPPIPTLGERMNIRKCLTQGHVWQSCLRKIMI